MKIIALEGIDGCGKTTLVDELAKAFDGDARVVFLHTPIAPFRELRQSLNPANKAETFWFYQASNSHLARTLSSDRVYVLDRFIYSTYIAHRSADPAVSGLIDTSFALLQLPVPIKTYLIRVSLATSWQRIHQRGPLTESEKLGLAAYGQLYATYYNPQAIPIRDRLLRDWEILDNEMPDDLQRNLQNIESTIRQALESAVEKMPCPK